MKLLPGNFGDPLADHQTVFRLGRASMDAPVELRASVAHFTLSSEDEAQNPPRLSVWAVDLTTPEQAKRLMGAGDPAKPLRLALYLDVGAVHQLRPVPNAEGVASPQVVWDPLHELTNGIAGPDTRPGAQGHAGIINLKPKAIPNANLMYKSYRSQLADLARVVILPSEEEPPIE